MAGAIIVRCESPEFQALYARTRDWDAVLRRELRKELHAAVRPASMAAKANARALVLSAAPPGLRPEHRSTGLRRGIANSVRVVQRAAGNGVEFRIVARHPMASATNSTGFRHPLFGNKRGKWYAQISQPWWDNAMRDLAPMASKAAHQALANAVDEI